MHLNYYFLKKLSLQLEKKLVGSTLVSCFSQQKEEIIFTFNSTHDLVLRARLESEITVLHFSDSFDRAKSNSIDLLGQLVDKEVISIDQNLNERSFWIVFQDNFRLLFKLHGRMSNIILFRGDAVDTVFKSSLKQDFSVDPNALSRLLDQSDEAILKSSFDLKSVFPTFDKIIHQHLHSQQFSTLSEDNKLKLLRSLLSQLEGDNIYIYFNGTLPILSLIPLQSDLLATYNDPIEAMNHFGKTYQSVFHLDKLKRNLLGPINKDLKKTDSYLRSTQSKLTELKEGRSMDEIANILMANLHIAYDTHQSSITLHDFYRDKEIDIKLKKNVSLQRNAEIFYKKQKNKAIELKKVEENIKARSVVYDSLLIKKQEIEETGDIRSLKKLDKSGGKNAKQKELPPFNHFRCEGYDIYVGRNAKNNDVLTQKFASKNDLWLHAKDVSGSHVVVKRQGINNIPTTVIEKAAQLAAWYSKRKTDSLCPVIYTSKKYVRKPKGSLPGQVVVMNEDVILVEPSKS